MTRLTIDLTEITDETALLSRLGEVFEFGGHRGNVPVSSSGARTGWGMNWDAARDSLAEIDTGGIWGTSRRFDFPIVLTFVGKSAFRHRLPEVYEKLTAVCAEVEKDYETRGHEFTVEFR